MSMSPPRIARVYRASAAGVVSRGMSTDADIRGTNPIRGINTIVEDRRGRIWIATPDGVWRVEPFPFTQDLRRTLEAQRKLTEGLDSPYVLCHLAGVRPEKRATSRPRSACARPVRS